jgi:hypothetical protein
VRTHSRVAHPGRKGLEGSRARRKVVRGKPRRGAVKPDTAESTRGDPPVEGPRRVKRTARNRLAARKRSPIGARVATPQKGGTCMQWPLGEGNLERAAQLSRLRARTTLKIRRTTYPPARETRRRFGGARTHRAHRPSRKPLKGSTSEPGVTSNPSTRKRGGVPGFCPRK